MEVIGKGQRVTREREIEKECKKDMGEGGREKEREIEKDIHHPLPLDPSLCPT